MKKFSEFNRALVAKKKFFLIISAVLLSVAMQATTFTKDLDLSIIDGANNATFNTETKIITPTAGWAGVGKWFGTYDVSKYTQIVIELASACSQNVSLSISHADGTADQSVIISAGETSGTIELNSASISNIWIALYSSTYEDVTIAINRIYFVGTVGEQSIVALSSEEKGTGSWADGVGVYASLFAEAHAGDQVIVSFEHAAGGEYNSQVGVTSNNQGLDSYPAPISFENSATQVRFTLTADDLAKVQANGIWIGGYYVTIKSVQLRKFDPLWRGSITINKNWNNYKEISTEDLSDLKVGNIIVVCVESIDRTQENEASVNLYCGWDDADALADGIHSLQAGSETKMVVEFPVTYKMEKQLRGRSLLVRGCNYTMTDVHIWEGTPTTTVAEYLTVSAAGMATYVLPFDVPSLPEGVEAYNLTNNGTDEIVAEQVYALTADKPVLIIADAGEYEFISEAGGSDDVSAKTSTYPNGALVGTYQAIHPLAETDGAGNYNYLLQNGASGVAFYQVQDNTCSVAPYRAYLSCGYNANAGGAGAPMRIRFKEDTATGMESNQQSAISVQKVLRDGQLYIIRDNKMYTIQGSIVK